MLHLSEHHRTRHRACRPRRELQLQPIQTWPSFRKGPTPCGADAERAARPKGVRKWRGHGRTRELRLPRFQRERQLGQLDAYDGNVARTIASTACTAAMPQSSVVPVLVESIR